MLMKKKDALKAIEALKKFVDGNLISNEEVSLIEELHCEVEFHCVPSDMNGMDEWAYAD